MLKPNILNMKNFLDTVNASTGKVNMLCPDGRKLNINGEEKIQRGCGGNISKIKTACGLF